MNWVLLMVVQCCSERTFYTPTTKTCATAIQVSKSVLPADHHSFNTSTFTGGSLSFFPADRFSVRACTAPSSCTASSCMPATVQVHRKGIDPPGYLAETVMPCCQARYASHPNDGSYTYENRNRFAGKQQCCLAMLRNVSSFLQVRSQGQRQLSCQAVAQRLEGLPDIIPQQVAEIEEPAAWDMLRRLDSVQVTLPECTVASTFVGPAKSSPASKGDGSERGCI